MTQKKKDDRPAIFVPIHSFTANIEGKDVSYREDEHYYEDDGALKLYPQLFRELKP